MIDKTKFQAKINKEDKSIMLSTKEEVNLSRANQDLIELRQQAEAVRRQTEHAKQTLILATDEPDKYAEQQVKALKEFIKHYETEQQYFNHKITVLQNAINDLTETKEEVKVSEEIENNKSN